MLDEMLEFGQYSFNCAFDDVKPRLAYKYLCKANSKTGNPEFSGLQRAMIIVARYYLFEHTTPSGICTTQSVAKGGENALKHLKAWCGAKLDEETITALEKEKPSLYNWLYKYIENQLLLQRVKQVIEDIDNNGLVLPDDVVVLIRKLADSKTEAEYKTISDEIQKIIDDNDEYGISEVEWNRIQNMVGCFDILKGNMQLIDIYDKPGEFEENIETFRKLLQQKYSRNMTDRVHPLINCIKAMLALEDKRKQFGHRMYKEQEVGKNDYKEIRYEGIIAKAFALGPLKRYFLALDDAKVLLSCEKYDGEEDDELLVDREETKQKKKPMVKCDAKDVEIILKTTAAYLLAKKYAEQGIIDAEIALQCIGQTVSGVAGIVTDKVDVVGLGEIEINKTDILNWLSSDLKPERYDEKIKKYKYKEKRIFKKKIISNSVKMEVAKGWQQHFRLIGEDEIKSFMHDNPNGAYFIDNGSGTELTKVMCTKTDIKA